MIIKFGIFIPLVVKKYPNLIMLLMSKATAWYIANGELLFISVANTGDIISCNVHVINMRRRIRKTIRKKSDSGCYNSIFG